MTFRYTGYDRYADMNGYQVVQFRVLAEERLVVLLLLVDEVLDVDVKAGGGDAF